MSTITSVRNELVVDGKRLETTWIERQREGRPTLVMLHEGLGSIALWKDFPAQLAARTVEATSGGGAVKVTAKCDGTIASIKIDAQALNPADAQLLEDMILSAVNSALSQARDISSAEMGKATAGLNIPGLGM